MWCNRLLQSRQEEDGRRVQMVTLLLYPASSQVETVRGSISHRAVPDDRCHRTDGRCCETSPRLAPLPRLATTAQPVLSPSQSDAFEQTTESTRSPKRPRL